MDTAKDFIINENDGLNGQSTTVPNVKSQGEFSNDGYDLKKTKSEVVITSNSDYNSKKGHVSKESTVAPWNFKALKKLLKSKFKSSMSNTNESYQSGKTPESEVSETEVQDYSSNSYLWKTHTFSVLMIGVAVLLYVVFFEPEMYDFEFNVKRGLIASLCAFLAFGVTQARDGPVIRPHPALWRLVICIAVVYELLLVFLLFQTVKDARNLLVHVDKNLNKFIEFKSYGNTCKIYDPGHPEGAFHNIVDKMDIFVIAHFVGWFWKALIFRDVWITNVISFMFELMEYTFEHQLPNFFECWWDHWVLDFIICNGLGIYLGLKVAKYLSMKEYTWHNVWNIHTYKGKMKRVVGQFTPYSWVKFRWKPTHNFYRWLFVSILVFLSLLAELNTFFLKFALWIPPSHPLVISRLVLYTLWAFVAIREAYDFANGKFDIIGQQAWVLCAIIITELMLVCKFSGDVISIPFPTHIKYFWTFFIFMYLSFSLWKFQLRFPLLRQFLKEAVRKWNEILYTSNPNIIVITDDSSSSSES